jgi:hypothetical protein
LALTASLAAAGTAAAVTITNKDPDSVHVMVCDDKCGPSHGDDWGSAFDFWLQPGEAHSFDCSGKCYVGLYYEDHSPTLGDMAMADDGEYFKGDEAGSISAGVAMH